MTSPQRLQIKLFTRQGHPGTESLIGQFHSWIQNDLLEEVAIDVADYSHVSDGPGVILITHEADYAFDEVGGAGLRYVRKKQVPGSLQEAVLQSYEQALKGASRLENEAADSVQFDPTTVEITLLDRRLYPNSAGTEVSVFDAIAQLFCSVFNVDEIVSSRVSGDPRYPFALRISVPHALSVHDLLEALGSTPVLVPSF